MHTPQAGSCSLELADSGWDMLKFLVPSSPSSRPYGLGMQNLGCPALGSSCKCCRGVLALPSYPTPSCLLPSSVSTGFGTAWKSSHWLLALCSGGHLLLERLQGTLLQSLLMPCHWVAAMPLCITIQPGQASMASPQSLSTHCLSNVHRASLLLLVPPCMQLGALFTHSKYCIACDLCMSTLCPLHPHPTPFFPSLASAVPWIRPLLQ